MFVMMVTNKSVTNHIAKILMNVMNKMVDVIKNATTVQEVIPATASKFNCHQSKWQGKYQVFNLCRQGFALQPDGRSCIDLDECKENPRICSGGKCTNTPGSYSCHCVDGLRPGPSPGVCLDIDECLQNPDICGAGTCVNTLGSFQCRCEDGYSVKPNSGPACSDDDECFLGSFTCHESADCINNPVS